MGSRNRLARFHADGYLNGGPVLTDAEVEELRAEITRVIDQRARKDVVQPVLVRNLAGDEAAPVWQIVNIWQASEPFRRLISTAR